MKARVFVTLKPSVLDPQGKAVMHSLKTLGYSEVSGVRQGKIFDITLEGNDPQAARERVEEMAKKLLANTIIEDFSVEIVEE